MRATSPDYVDLLVTFPSAERVPAFALHARGREIMPPWMRRSDAVA